MSTADGRRFDGLISAGPALEADGWWALSRAALEYLLGEVASGRERVVECGSGVSTVLISRLLRERGRGHLWSLEHDREWAELTRELVATEGLGEHVSVIDAPLRPEPLAQPGCQWYDREALAALPPEVDLLLVDGPPAGSATAQQSRYPALPLLAGRLAPGALVALDDARRPGEAWVLRRWEQEHGIEFERRPEGLAVAAWPRHPPRGTRFRVRTETTREDLT